MIGYVTLGTDDLERARTYFDALLGSIGAKRVMQFADEDGGFTYYGVARDRPGIAITRPYDKQPAAIGNGNMVAMSLDEPAQVDAFHARALELGGSNEGGPGYRGDPRMGFYGAYFRDPDGHKFCAFCIAPKS